MLVDLLIGAIVIAAGVWGYRRGLSTGAFAAAGFAAGAIIGSRVAPLALNGGLDDPFAPAVSLPAALLVGALLAAGMERLGYRLRLRIRRRSPADLIAGAALAACVAVVAVWIMGVAAAQVDSFKETLRESSVIEELNAALPPPGPLLKAKKRPQDPLPKLAGPAANVGPADPRIRRDPQVRAAARRVLKVFAKRCGLRVTGTGWAAGNGLVVTTAHVVQGSEPGGVAVKVRGIGSSHPAEVVSFDQLNDVAVLRVEGIGDVPLRVDPTLEPGIYVAGVGFPEGGALRFTPGRMGNNARLVEEDRTVTVMRVLGARPGSSGSPAVDRHGRVVTMLAQAGADGRFIRGVPPRPIRRALGRARAGRPADTAECE